MTNLVERDAEQRFSTRPNAALAARAAGVPVLDVVVPVYNEQVALPGSIRRLHRHLEEHFPYPVQITIADNASIDDTPLVAAELAAELDNVRVLHLDLKGRGRALHAAWSTSPSPVLVYMDVDLSTDLAALGPLVAPLISGHSDLAIGTRLSRASRVVRGPKREFISRCYNLILRSTLSAKFSDAQCGFKAIRADVAHALLPLVEDTGWFFDTELLVLAERSGLRIHEVPIDWVDDPDSRVRVAQTARRDLAGMARMAWRFLRGAGRIDGATYRRAELADQMGRQLVVFGLIGAISTAVSAGLFLTLREPLGAVLANVVAVTTTVAVNAWANRRFTFGRRGRLGRSSDYLRAGAIYLVGLVVSTFVLLAISPTDHLVELLALLATWSLTTVARFTVLSHTPITSTEVQP